MGDAQPHPALSAAPAAATTTTATIGLLLAVKHTNPAAKVQLFVMQSKSRPNYLTRYYGKSTLSRMLKLSFCVIHLDLV